MSRKRTLAQKIERTKNKLDKAKPLMAAAIDPVAIRDARMSVIALEKNLASMARAMGQPNQELEAAIKDKKQLRAERQKAMQASRGFYKSPQWRALRYRVLVEQGRRCVCCGATPKDGVRMHVDHIKPKSLHPELAFDPSNLQVLCEDCNLGKSNTCDKDFR